MQRLLGYGSFPQTTGPSARMTFRSRASDRQTGGYAGTSPHLPSTVAAFSTLPVAGRDCPEHTATSNAKNAAISPRMVSRRFIDNGSRCAFCVEG